MKVRLCLCVCVCVFLSNSNLSFLSHSHVSLFNVCVHVTTERQDLREIFLSLSVYHYRHSSLSGGACAVCLRCTVCSVNGTDRLSKASVERREERKEERREDGESTEASRGWFKVDSRPRQSTRESREEKSRGRSGGKGERDLREREARLSFPVSHLFPLFLPSFSLSLSHYTVPLSLCTPSSSSSSPWAHYVSLRCLLEPLKRLSLSACS